MYVYVILCIVLMFFGINFFFFVVIRWVSLKIMSFKGFFKYIYLYVCIFCLWYWVDNFLKIKLWCVLKF